MVYEPSIERNYLEFIFWERIMRGHHRREDHAPVLYPFELAQVNGHLRQYIDEAFASPILTVKIANTFSL